MKNLITILLALSVFFISEPPVTDNTFCEGWQLGYVEGFCNGTMGCIRPVPPICPIPPYNCSDYLCGYNKGFITGYNDRI